MRADSNKNLAVQLFELRPLSLYFEKVMLRSLQKSPLVFVLVFTSFSLFSQQYEVVELNNPSFDEIPHKGGAVDIGIRGWYDCGLLQFPRESPPDIHPINAWEVTMLASEGPTYLGMVVRDNDSWESISQRVKIPIEEGKCYKFKVDLARSLSYVSGSRLTGQKENYVRPAVLRIFGGTGVCGRQELLAQSSTITKDQWQTYEFEFNPERTSNYFTIEAFYKTPALIPYNGHVLVDNASNIERIPCDDEEPLLVEELAPIVANNAAPIKKANPKKQIHEERVTPIIEEAQETASKKLLEEQEELSEELISSLASLKVGSTLPVRSIYFPADSFHLKDESYEAIDKIYDFMSSNRNVVIEIGGTYEYRAFT